MKSKTKRTLVKKSFFSDRLVFLVFGLVICIYYARSVLGFYQGDEWFYFSQFLPFTREPFGFFSALYKSIFDIQDVSGGGHLTPIYNLIWFSFNFLYKLNYFPYIVTSIIFHILNTFLLYIFVRQLVNNRLIGFIAGIFFGISFVHQQAVTWIMAFVPTVISVTFLLLSLIFVLSAAKESSYKIYRRNLLWSMLFALCAFLTKESTVILLILLPLIIYWKNRKYLNRKFFKFYLLLCVLYLPFRALLPKFLSWLSAQTGNIVEPVNIGLDLHIFRIITYPLKALAEVFIPSKVILWLSEFLTPYAYPGYAAEKEVRGINFLTFTQGAGSDILIYIFSLLLIFIIVVSIFKLRNRNIVYYHASILGFLLIVMGALPLVFIAYYAPWWAYVTFIDSRHLYIISIGGALLFALATYGLGVLFEKMLSRYHLKMARSVYFTLCLAFLWAILQFLLFQDELNYQVKTGEQRKTVIAKVLGETTIRDKTAILVTSDTGYYGFGPIPPFQTNLGQVLSIYFYQDRGLPEYFIHNNFLTKGGIAGEGYKEFDGKGFGYFVEKNNLLKAVAANQVDPEYISAFKWMGKDSQLINVTSSVRTEARNYKKQVDAFGGWEIISNKQEKYSFKFPAEMSMQDITESSREEDPNVIKSVIIQKDNEDSTTLAMQLDLKKKPELIPFSDYVSLQETSDGQKIDQNFTFRNIKMLSRDVITTVYPTKGSYPQYFVPFKTNDKFFEARVSGAGTERSFYLTDGGFNEQYNTEIESILSTIKYEE